MAIMAMILVMMNGDGLHQKEYHSQTRSRRDIDLDFERKPFGEGPIAVV